MNRFRSNTLIAVTLVGLFCLTGCKSAPEEKKEECATCPFSSGAKKPQAMAKLVSKDGSGISGTVTFRKNGDAVEVVANVSGLPAGEHGFHVHEVGDCSAADFTSAGSHFNPSKEEHGGPLAVPSHAGDLGNIVASSKEPITYSVTSSKITLDDAPNSIIGRSLIIHADPDDFRSQPTGNAGSRIACGVIVKE